MGDDPPIAVSYRRVSLAGSYRLLRPPERGRLPVLWPPRRPGGVAETEPSRALGPDRRVCGDGGASLLRPHPLRLGAGIPLGMSEERFRSGQESGTWIYGALFLGNFILVGAVLMPGLVQRWGEVFPRWMIGLAGRRVPIALAVVPASLASVFADRGRHRDMGRPGPDGR